MKAQVSLFAALLLCACGPAPDSGSAAQGREETRSIRNLEQVGVDGNAIADKVDAVLDAGEQRRRKEEEALQGQ